MLPGVLAGATLLIGGGESAALPLVKELPPATPHVMVEDGTGAGPPPQEELSGAGQNAPLAELTEALAAARAKLEQLNRAAEALAGAAALRSELAAREAELVAQQEDNRRLLSELQSLHARRAEWQRADDAKKAEIEGLGQALDQAAAEAKKLDGELAAVRWQNAQLSTSLSRARDAQEAAEAEAEAVRAELGAQVDELMAAAKTSAGEISRVRGQLSATAERLNEVNEALTVAEQERDTASSELDRQRARADRLSGQLTVAEADLEQARAASRDLETRIAGLEQAATVATDAARQNLAAVESQIAALNSTLTKVELGPESARSATPEGGEAAAGADRPAGAGPAAQGPNGVDSGTEASALAVAPAAGPAQPAEGELALIKRSAPRDVAVRSLAALTAELPVESRIQVQSLLADLEAETDPQGVKLIVPGGELFTVNGQEVRDTAYDSLAKVAELINLYKSQPVLIIGHTDAVGEPEYNRTLSERRASLVRAFFVEHFDVEAARLSTQGMGERLPIASNATAAGRRANRRVEVLILN